MPRTLSTVEVSDFRERLCEAATRLFAEKGLEGLTLRELANELGVSAMTPYRYFKDKDEMLAAVRARAFNRFAETLERAFSQPGNAPTRANAAGEAYIRFALEDPASYRLMFDLSQPDDRYPELKAAAERARLTLTQHIHPLVEGGFLKGDPEIIGHVFWAMLHGAIMLHLSGKLDPDCDFRKVISEAFRALTIGFQPDAQNR
jgi:AcrR family transcriptional regulator